MEKVHTIIRTEINTLVSGLRIKRTVMEYFNMKMEQFMMESGSTIRHAIKVRLFILAKINMKEIS